MYGGALSVYSVGNGVIKVEVGDGEGLADEYVFECETVDEGLSVAENQAQELINEALELQSMYLDGDVKSVDQEIIRITGLPPMRNPYYDSSK